MTRCCHFLDFFGFFCYALFSGFLIRTISTYVYLWCPNSLANVCVVAKKSERERERERERGMLRAGNRFWNFLYARLLLLSTEYKSTHYTFCLVSLHAHRKCQVSCAKMANCSNLCRCAHLTSSFRILFSSFSSWYFQSVSIFFFFFCLLGFCPFLFFSFFCFVFTSVK